MASKEQIKSFLNEKVLEKKKNLVKEKMSSHISKIMRNKKISNEKKLNVHELENVEWKENEENFDEENFDEKIQTSQPSSGSNDPVTSTAKDDDYNEMECKICFERQIEKVYIPCVFFVINFFLCFFFYFYKLFFFFQFLKKCKKNV